MPRLKRALAYGLIASVLLGAALGIVAVLRNQWSWFEVRILLTTAILAAACICGLVSDLARTPRGLNLLPLAGLGLTLVTTLLLLYLVWGFSGGPGPGDMLIQTSCCLAIFTVATVHMSLLSVARLAPRFQWTLWAAYCIIFALASLLSAQVIREFHGDEDMLRPIAVLSILAVAITLVIPLLHRISQTDPNFTALSLHDEHNAAAIDAEIEKLQRRLAYLQKLRSQLEGKQLVA